MTLPEEEEDLNFKSDLLFAANPDVSPYCLEPDRMDRMVELILYEATEAEESDDEEDGPHGLSPSAASVWEFLCTARNPAEGAEDLYVRTVRRIADGLEQ
eukprot:CAMPEP_0183325752 /NCGR_PEP_ID=MMETSP0160_2-20130417/80382_1 /TAXON_ID=2839 ORGANISM="Odontella Sinensis, Strain Grunow 1884" /NCGR_SAMPLE_ID=MMETSP0160_2 /ASSEMBLY_ACC=CAM_ASM_000250 /LENGTH=99 /DNA_ID=CAMNT_0025493599 /DNA_START=24 /DNA_END=323 /DNA_ORIENTATION=+